MNKSKLTLLSILLALSTIFFFLYIFNFSGIVTNIWFAIFISVTGIATFYFSFLTADKLGIIVSVILFLSGVILFATKQFELLTFVDFLFSSLLFITSVSCVMIYFSKKSNLNIFILSLFFLAASYFCATSLNDNYYVERANRFILFMLNFWPSMLFISTLFLLIKKK